VLLRETATVRAARLAVDSAFALTPEAMDTVHFQPAARVAPPAVRVRVAVLCPEFATVVVKLVCPQPAYAGVAREARVKVGSTSAISSPTRMSFFAANL
jgi:hypothetical protein